MATGAAAIPYILGAVAAAGEYYNTEQTAKRQDQAQAQAIIDQGNIQKQANQRVDQTIQQMQGSNADQARQDRLTSYMQTLQEGKARTDAGLDNPMIGGQAFQQDSAKAADAANAYAGNTANLLSRIDAPVVQRQQEGNDYGHLATDLNLLGSKSASQNFLDQLRAASIRRNAKIDLAAHLLGTAGSAMGTPAGGTGAASGGTFNGATGAGTYTGPQSVYGYGWGNLGGGA